jgi:hypothetical protein
VLFTETFATVAEHFYLLSNNEKQCDINEFFLYLEHFESTTDDAVAFARATMLVNE